MAKMRFSSIHRSTLLKTLFLTEKIPADFEGVFKDVKCYGSFLPSWWTKVVVEEGDREPHVRKYDDFMGKFDIKVAKGYKHSSGKKSSTHRVFVICKCGKNVPAGRIGQHRCEHWPTKELIESFANHK